jgi:DNA-binding response OmpR family regulator
MKATNDHSCKVLVVDDDKDILEVLKILLSVSGLQVEAISQHGEIYDNLFLFKPDVILLDVNLGACDGRTICKDLKSQAETKDISIIMFSANHNIRQSALDNNADGFIEKPFEIDQLVNTVKGHCKHARTLPLN